MGSMSILDACNSWNPSVSTERIEAGIRENNTMCIIVQHDWNRFRFLVPFVSRISLRYESRDDRQKARLTNGRPMKVERVLGLAPKPRGKKEVSKQFVSVVLLGRTHRRRTPYEPRRALVAFSYTRRPVVAKEIRNKGDRTLCGRPR